jgi:hypothetical protein
METQIKFNKKCPEIKEITIGNWYYYKKYFRKKFGMNFYVDVAWGLAKKTKYYNNGRRTFPFFRNRVMKSFLLQLFTTNFHEIVHIEMQKIGVNDFVCTDNAHKEDNVCWWCNYTNNELHGFFIERGVEI